jgi:hypothetical protein
MKGLRELHQDLFHFVEMVLEVKTFVLEEE